MPHAEWLKNAVHLRRLEKMAAELRKLSAGDERERNDD
jgi:UDP-3-O-[3-hydroxymyristoyl] glucosamine N-acyltransferase